MYLAAALFFNAFWPLVLLIPMLAVLHGRVIRREERYLEAKFGAPYRTTGDACADGCEELTMPGAKATSL